MTANVYNPFHEMDRFFDQLAKTASRDTNLMPMDLYRDGDTYIAKLDLPGVDPSSIDVGIDDRTLTVSAERKSDEIKRDDKSHWVSRERSYGAYARQITLGAGLDLSQISADYSDGVLTLTIPVAEEAKPRKIEVTSHANQVSIENVDAPESNGDADNN